MVWLDWAVVGSLASAWSLGGCGLARLGGYGLMPGSRGVGLARWWHGLVGLGGCGFFGFWLGLRGGVGVCRGLMRRWGGVGWGEGNGLYMRELNMCVRRLNMQS